MGLYAEVDLNLTLCLLQSRLQHIYHGQPYAIVDLNPMPESTLTLCQSPPSQGLWIWLLENSLILKYPIRESPNPLFYLPGYACINILRLSKYFNYGALLFPPGPLKTTRYLTAEA